MTTEINEGRGFPLADEGEPIIALAPHRVLLFRIVRRALRSENGVREQQAKGKPTGFYAGRRAASIANAADLCAVLYGGDYDAAKAKLTEAVRAAGEAYPAPRELIHPDTFEPLAQAVVEQVLRVI
jgi:hypothetical protein